MDSNEVRKEWAERSGEYSPSYYAYYGPDETSELILDLLDSFVGSDAAVVELGCSSGRHLAHLRDNGYDDLHGVEINDEAFDVMAETYPDLAADGTFYNDAIENAVAAFEDDRFDAVFSVETLQHIHPEDEAVFGELARITGDLLVTVENENRDGEAESDRNIESQSDRAEGSDTGNDAEPGDRDSDGELAARRGVNYVDGEFPLYYRNWNRIFTERGLTEVECQSTKRDMLRAFRSDGD
ncbi:bifunctional 2-polyprenyl-6-hydroxyphenol methylase/3-demethylubiquinol 3-O-methyltransferase UbiG [Halorussus sp. MSC15.2]|uniref:class I SAM-dependent methyltransferase n=1 Tax=Halorussus sp. MSC15.2 TaxID=2283638 RepID=UPI0013D7FE7D|nr:class I SAM-dependent methyltransferase [Halorussus sp. MSC15.2]NEU56806.1 class I SAM-dependent methyltransferase [Halorussus sp. MSC15.2]